MVPEKMVFFVDTTRCIGCKACYQACSECDTHKGVSMIHLDVIDRERSVQTVPMVCMHCEEPTCANVCPADAIKRTPDGVVQTARKSRCVACNNCVLACPFGVPKMEAGRGAALSGFNLMMKCDMCYDRTSVGKKPMCATVCPSGALAYMTAEQMEEERPRSRAINEFRFGRQLVKTKVRAMVPRHSEVEEIKVTDALQEQPDILTLGMYQEEEA